MKNGDKPVPGIHLVEKHFFKGNLIKTYDFQFGFMIPGTENQWETIYDLPQFTEEQKMELITSPNEVTSDSYFFVGNELVIHERCRYNYL